jgi:hypothetical protein
MFDSPSKSSQLRDPKLHVITCFTPALLASFFLRAVNSLVLAPSKSMKRDPNMLQKGVENHVQGPPKNMKNMG